MLKAIETQYKGYRFRSRLEARWAVFFDVLGVKWEYEKEGFDLGEAGWYLPDFWLPDKKVWVEIKGDAPTEDECDKAQELEEQSQFQVLIFRNIPDEGEPLVSWTNFYFGDGRDGETGISIPVSDDWFSNLYNLSSICSHNQSSIVSLCCPVCKDDRLSFLSNDLQNNAMHKRTVLSRNGTPIVFATLSMSASCGHNWSIEYMGISDGSKSAKLIISANISIDIHLSDGDLASLDHASAAARSARFEHGESLSAYSRYIKPEEDPADFTRRVADCIRHLYMG